MLEQHAQQQQQQQLYELLLRMTILYAHNLTYATKRIVPFPAGRTPCGMTVCLV
jgi:hypothetical protein